MQSTADTQDYDFESPEGVRPPGFHLRALEARAPYEALSSLALWPLLQAGPRGDGHPVLVLPGLVAHDSSTRLLRKFLVERGFAPHGWGQGINFGPHPHVVEACVERIRFLFRQSGGRKVSLVGQSLGGVYARVLAGLAEDSGRHAGQPAHRHGLGQQCAAPVSGGERPACASPGVLCAAEAAWWPGRRA